MTSAGCFYSQSTVFKQKNRGKKIKSLPEIGRLKGGKILILALVSVIVCIVLLIIRRYALSILYTLVHIDLKWRNLMKCLIFSESSNSWIVQCLSGIAFIFGFCFQKTKKKNVLNQPPI